MTKKLKSTKNSVRSDLLNLGYQVLPHGVKSVKEALVFNYRWGPSRCWAIRPLYGFKRRYNGLRSSICKYNQITCHVASNIHCNVYWFCYFIAMTSGSDDSDEDSDSGNPDYQFSTPKGSYSQSHYSNLMRVSIQKLEFKSHGLAALSINANRLYEAHSHSYSFTIYKRRSVA